MFKVIKKTRTKGGKKVPGRYWCLRFQTDDMAKERCFSLRVTDKQTAEQKAKEFMIRLEREEVGLLPSDREIDSASKPISQHLDEHLAVKRTRGTKEQQIGICRTRVKNICTECDWIYLKDVTAHEFEMWRNKHASEYSPKTLNEYLAAIKGMFNWLEKLDLITSNPLKGVEKVCELGKKTRERRAFTDDELRRLVKVSDKFGLVYFTAARSGLRLNELKQLLWADIHLDSKQSYILARAKTTKNKKEEPVIMVPELADALRKARPKNVKLADRVFAQGVPVCKRLQKDLKQAGIAYRDDLGRFADFHALRYTFCTFMAVNDVPVRFAMKQMRHSDMKLTLKIYTDEGQLPIAEEMNSLPALMTEGSRIGSRKIVSESLNVSQPVFESCEAESSEPLKYWDNVSECLEESGNSLERVMGIEPTYGAQMVLVRLIGIKAYTTPKSS